MTDLTALPPDLPEPEDDGAAGHLLGIEMPAVALPAADGSGVTLEDPRARFTVVYVYPRTGGPGIDLPDDWDLIPGARGCTPQSCSFRDHHGELTALGASVRGVSAQPAHEQRDFAARMHIPFPLLNDAGLALAADPLRLPTFSAGGLTLYRRLTLVAAAGRVVRVFYPVFPPDRNAADVISFLADAG